MGLLHLVRGPRPPHLVSRAFNCWKSEERDRLIIDRRGPNGAEGRIVGGPSSRIPAGSRLTELSLLRGSEALRISAADRQDMYYQCAVSDERAATNVLGSPCALAAFQDFPSDPLSALKERDARMSSGGRSVRGDRFLLASRRAAGALTSSHVRGETLSGASSAYGAIATLPMGDHAAVDFCQDAHGNLLRHAGLLRPGSCLDARCPTPLASTVDGLVIDDYFVLGRMPLAEAKDPQGPDLDSFDQARAAYRKHELRGSPDKETRGSPAATIIGAEIESSEGWVRRGYVPVGVPVARRLATSVASLRAAALDCLSPSLASTLAGLWSSVFQFRRPLMSVLHDIYPFASSASPDISPFLGRSLLSLLWPECLPHWPSLT